MLKIRFQRAGRKNDPAFRMVVTEHTASPRAGKHVATVGSYHPKTKHTLIDAEAVKKWMGHGAKASGTVHNLLVTQGVIEGKKVNVLSKKTPTVKDSNKTNDSQNKSTPDEAEEKEDASAEATASEEGDTDVSTEADAKAGAPVEEAPKGKEKAAEAPTPEEEKKEETAS